MGSTILVSFMTLMSFTILVEFYETQFYENVLGIDGDLVQKRALVDSVLAESH